MKKLFLMFVAMSAFASAWAIEQDSDGCYLIGSVADWKAFAEIVNTTPNANARMIADVDLGDDQTMIGSGTNENATGSGNLLFQGIFDGQGHSLTINYYTDEIFVAPFRHIQNATIKNLHVKGKISTSNRDAGGIVGACFGNNIHSYITNCRSSVEIVSNYVNTGDFYGGAWHGGIAARLFYYGQLHITDCLFDGHISGESKGVVWGGMLGMPDGTVSFQNCLQVGTLDAEGVIGGGNGSGTFSSRFSNGYASFINVDNCYYRTVFGNAQGTQATDEQLSDGTIAAALQAGRDVEVWVQDEATGMPRLKIFSNEPEPDPVRGDINGDGNVDVTDVSIAIDIILGKDTPGLLLSAEPDLDGNGVVDVSDVSMLIDLVLGKDVPEPTIRTYIVNGVSFRMVRVDGGSFSMGATDEQVDDAYSDEKPVHTVTLKGYSIGETEVTQALWQAVMGTNPSYYPGDLNCPVERVSWDDCQTFITGLNRLTGRKFRLPTEAEWEYAARGGNKSQGFKYAGSNTVNDVAWHWRNSDSSTHPVAMKAPNELGLYDMSGNVWEWCKDWRGDYSSNACTNPLGPASGTLRILRGGAWSHMDTDCRVSVRNSSAPGNSNGTMGLRLAM